MSGLVTNFLKRNQYQKNCSLCIWKNAKEQLELMRQAIMNKLVFIP